MDFLFIRSKDFFSFIVKTRLNFPLEKDSKEKGKEALGIRINYVRSTHPLFVPSWRSAHSKTI